MTPQPSTHITKKMRSRIQEGVCLVCACKNNARRGLCPKHYKMFRVELDKRYGDGKEQYEARMIAAGKVLPMGGRRKFLSDEVNPFVEDQSGE